MTDKVQSLFTGTGSVPATPVQIQPAKVYNVKLKGRDGNGGTLFENQLGYLSVNGLFAVLTDSPNDPMSVNFYALMEDIEYIVESDEVATETI